MNKLAIGILFILFGSLYGLLAIDSVYRRTLGYLIQHGLITPPAGKSSSTLFGRKPTIILYSFVFIIIGIFILWNRNI